MRRAHPGVLNWIKRGKGVSELTAAFISLCFLIVMPRDQPCSLPLVCRLHCHALYPQTMALNSFFLFYIVSEQTSAMKNVTNTNY